MHAALSCDLVSVFQTGPDGMGARHGWELGRSCSWKPIWIALVKNVPEILRNMLSTYSPVCLWEMRRACGKTNRFSFLFASFFSPNLPSIVNRGTLKTAFLSPFCVHPLRWLGYQELTDVRKLQPSLSNYKKNLFT